MNLLFPKNRLLNLCHHHLKKKKKKVQVGTQLSLRFIVNFVSDVYMWFFYKSSDSTARQLKDDLYISRERTGYYSIT